MSNTIFKVEPAYDITNCDDEEYLNEDSETEQTQENSTTTSTSSGSITRRTKTNPAQFQKLIAYMRYNGDFNRDSRRPDPTTPFRIDDQWDGITAELNAIGPPFRTNAQWRRAWTVYKSNKRRRKPKEAVGDENKWKRIKTYTLSGNVGYDM